MIFILKQVITIKSEEQKTTILGVEAKNYRQAWKKVLLNLKLHKAGHWIDVSQRDYKFLLSDDSAYVTGILMNEPLKMLDLKIKIKPNDK